MACTQCSEGHAQASCCVCDRLFCDFCLASHQSRHRLTQQLVSDFHEPLSHSQLDSCGAISPAGILDILSSSVHGPLLESVLLDSPVTIITYPLLQRLLAIHYEPLSTLCVEFLSIKIAQSALSMVASDLANAFLPFSSVLLSQSSIATRSAICQLFYKTDALLPNLMTFFATTGSDWVHWLSLASVPELFTQTQLAEVCSSFLPQSVSALVGDYASFGGKELALLAMDVWGRFLQDGYAVNNSLVTPIVETLLVAMRWRRDECLNENEDKELSSDDEVLVPPRSKHAKVECESVESSLSISSPLAFSPSQSPFPFSLSALVNPVSPPKGGWEVMAQVPSTLRVMAASNFDLLSTHHLAAALEIIAPRLTAFLKAGRFQKCDLNEGEMLEAETYVLALGAVRSSDRVDLISAAFGGLTELIKCLKSDHTLLVLTTAWSLGRYARNVPLFPHLMDVLLTNQHPRVQQSVLSTLGTVVEEMSPTEVCDVIEPYWQPLLCLLPLMKSDRSQILYFEVWGSLADRGEEIFGAKYGRDLVWFLWQTWNNSPTATDFLVTYFDSLELTVKHAKLSTQEMLALWVRTRERIMVETQPSVMISVLDLASGLVEKAWNEGFDDVILQNLEPDTFFVYLMELASTEREGVQGAALSVVGTLALDDHPGNLFMATLFTRANYATIFECSLSVPNAIWAIGNMVELCKPSLDQCTRLASSLYSTQNHHHNNSRFALAQIAGVAPEAVKSYVDVFSWICLEVGRASDVRIIVILVKAIIAISTYMTWSGYAKVYQPTYGINGTQPVHSTQVLVFRALMQLLTRAPDRCKRHTWLEPLRSWRYYARENWNATMGEVAFDAGALCQSWGIRDVFTLWDVS